MRGCLVGYPFCVFLGRKGESCFGKRLNLNTLRAKQDYPGACSLAAEGEEVTLESLFELGGSELT